MYDSGGSIPLTNTPAPSCASNPIRDGFRVSMKFFASPKPGPDICQELRGSGFTLGLAQKNELSVTVTLAYLP
jgi:hypothetical protein